MSINHPRMAKSLLLRAHPFQHMLYFDETRTDCIMFRAAWAERFNGVAMEQYDLAQQAHQDAVGYGRVILFFQARIRPMKGVEGTHHRLAFVEEFWPLPEGIWKGGASANRDILSTEFGCRRLYGGSPQKIYTVMRIECILGPAHIVPDPVHRTVPHASVFSSKLDHGRSDTSSGSGTGSELFRLYRWTTTWASEGALPEEGR